ncbi:bifunctional adenosylcobinamide kinase/adenosylcobinamide-phosphate guanylyltransferase [Actibacterium sp. 188UL27-1]|uniref:bifunctional adenosylcobinamide kinase/adenosylcobinamide-phosphate guanylyltransferase n=1 Tax=Actibacterium sp. 188UL27-1 TaxID=2786961 RepID=UPI001EF6B460|nr:bifunctional adenosylcobinamide kinase/adenosylcobinamide-phosphate guanylyltransferase [Actibacterium sp. 188UL27-1]
MTLVLGGASSGKSSFAEKLVDNYNISKCYIATAQAFDDEMRAKIDAHKNARGTGWTTLEVPHDVPLAVSDLQSEQVVLLDCATLWLSNRLLANADLETEVDALIDALAKCACPIVVVSNEVGQGIVPDTKLGRQFRIAQGQLNRRLAAQAQLVVQVVAGLPLVLKGTLPEDLL